MDATFWTSIESGATVITANARLAAWLGRAYDQRQQRAGRRAWASPAILSLEAWLERSWAAAGGALLLSGTQERWLWEEILAESDAAQALLDRTATARLAAGAWRLGQAWQLDFDAPEWRQTEETSAFQAWARELRRRCRETGWITAAELPQGVGARIDGRGPRGAVDGGRIWLAGFDELTPQQETLVEALRGAGAAVETVAARRPAAEPRLVVGRETEDEIRQAAEWARGWLEAGGGKEAAEEIPVGVIVPGLEGARAAVERIFTAVLHPGRAPWSEAARAFNLSLGVPLARYPVVAAAEMLLETMFAAEAIEMDGIGRLLRSPFWRGGESEATRRAGLERELRSGQWPRLRLEELQARAERCPLLRTALERGRAARAKWPRRQSYSGWAVSFEQMVEALGWPGERAPSSGEYQAVEAWSEALAELGSLDQVAGAAGPAGAGGALARLRQIAAGRVFQPRTERGVAAPVQILGWLEASGLEFQHLWIMGLHDGAVPAAAAPHPFLPPHWQRERGMPHASPAREAEFAAQTLERLRRSSGDVVVSYPAWQGEIELRPSPLLGGMEAGDERGEPEAAAAPPAMETLADAGGPAVADELVRGGSKIFAEQAACPFRAFAHLRLHAAGLEEGAAGLAPVTRGNLLHGVLQRVWERLGSQATLLGMAAEFVEALVEECAAATVEAEARLHGRRGLAELERQRLTRQTLAWLECERKRPAFTVIGREEERTVELGGVALHLRLDRVDALADGRRVLIDYKSGETSKGDWDIDRMTAPQLPLYLVTDPEPGTVAAIAFAQLQPGKMSFKAAARENGILPRAQIWTPPEDATGWRLKLEELAGEFLAGRAEVAPKQKKTCEYCDLDLLCRVGETALGAELERRGELDKEGGGDGE